MKWIAFALSTALLASIAFGDGLAITFDPPQKVEAVKAGEKNGDFFAATVGTVGEKEFSKMAYVRWEKEKPWAMRSEASSPFSVLALGKAVTAQSLVITWKGGAVTGYLQSKEGTFRIDFEKAGDKGVVTKVDAKDVPKWDMFPRFNIPESGGPDFIDPKRAR